MAESFFSTHVDFVLNLVLSLFAIVLAYWFWRNPINTDFRRGSRIPFVDNSTGDKYYLGEDHNGWKIRKLISRTGREIGDIGEVFASKKNNPKVKVMPNNLEEIKKLNFE